MEVNLALFMADEPDAQPSPAAQPAPVEPAEPTKTATEKIDRQQLETAVRLCLENYPEKLAAMKKLKPAELTDDELEECWKQIEFTMGATQNLRTAVGGMIMGIQMLELGTIAASGGAIKVQGLSQICNNQDVLDDIKFICIKNIGGVNTSPEMRLGIAIAQHALRLHTVNSMNSAAQPEASTVSQPPAAGLDDSKFDEL